MVPNGGDEPLATLGYAAADGPVGPVTAVDGKRVLIDLGSASTATFVCTLVLAAAAVLFGGYAAATARSVGDRVLFGGFAAFAALSLAVRAANRHSSDVVVADESAVGSSSAAPVAKADVVRFAVRRLGLPWLARLDVVTVGDGLVRHRRTTLASGRHHVVRAAAAVLNDWLGDRLAVPQSPVPAARRWRNWAVIAAVFAGSLVAAAGLGYAGWQWSEAETLVSDVLFGAAVVVILAPIFAMMVAVQGGTRTPARGDGPPRLHRNNAAEWVMVAVLAPAAWFARGWGNLRERRRRERAEVAAAKRPKRSLRIEGLPPRTMN